MNKVILSGNIVEDVQFLKTSEKGTFFTRNKIAVQDNAKTDYEKTYFIPFRAFNKEVLKEFKSLKKGKLIEIEGKLVHENYKKDNEWKTYTEIIVFKVKEIKFNKKNKDSEQEGFQVISDDDIPF